MLSLLYDPTLTSIHDYWKNHSLDYIDVCWLLLGRQWEARNPPWGWNEESIVWGGVHSNRNGRWFTSALTMPLPPRGWDHDLVSYFTGTTEESGTVELLLLGEVFHQAPTLTPRPSWGRPSFNPPHTPLCTDSACSGVKFCPGPAPTGAQTQGARALVCLRVQPRSLGAFVQHTLCTRMWTWGGWTGAQSPAQTRRCPSLVTSQRPRFWKAVYLASFKRDFKFPNLLFFKNDRLVHKLAKCSLCLSGAEVLGTVGLLSLCVLWPHQGWGAEGRQWCWRETLTHPQVPPLMSPNGTWHLQILKL